VAAKSVNIEKLANAFEAFNRRDVEAYIAALGVPDDYEWRPFLTSGTEGGVYRGRAGTREWFANLGEVFESFSVEASAMRDLGDQLLILGTLHGRGRGSGAPVESPVGIVVELDADGIPRRGIAFASHAEALAHAGAETSSNSPASSAAEQSA
jgi:ketosteroid isomerase-like protein